MTCYRHGQRQYNGTEIIPLRNMDRCCRVTQNRDMVALEIKLPIDRMNNVLLYMTPYIINDYILINLVLIFIYTPCVYTRRHRETHVPKVSLPYHWPDNFFNDMREREKESVRELDELSFSPRYILFPPNLKVFIYHRNPNRHKTWR